MAQCLTSSQTFSQSWTACITNCFFRFDIAWLVFSKSIYDVMFAFRYWTCLSDLLVSIFKDFKASAGWLDGVVRDLTSDAGVGVVIDSTDCWALSLACHWWIWTHKPVWSHIVWEISSAHIGGTLYCVALKGNWSGIVMMGWAYDDECLWIFHKRFVPIFSKNSHQYECIIIQIMRHEDPTLSP